MGDGLEQYLCINICETQVQPSLVFERLLDELVYMFVRLRDLSPIRGGIYVCSNGQWVISTAESSMGRISEDRHPSHYAEVILMTRKAFGCVLVLAILSSCGDSQGEPPGTDDSPRSSEVTEGDAVARSEAEGRPIGLSAIEGVSPDGTVNDFATVADSARSQGLSDNHVTALADGSVTFSEYEQLTKAALECIREAGIDVVDTGIFEDPIQEVSLIGYAISSSAAGMSEDAIRGREATCLTVHSWAAQELYVLQNAVPAEEQNRRILERFESFRDCLEGAGFDVPEMDDMAGNFQPLLEYLDTPGHTCETP